LIIAPLFRKLAQITDNVWHTEHAFTASGVPITSRTLILTDLCQWWQGDLPLIARFFASVTGVRKQVAVPRTIRALVKDRQAARRSADAVLKWPFERVIMAHNAIIETNAHAEITREFHTFG
jgi:hypothetical protein